MHYERSRILAAIPVLIALGGCYNPDSRTAQLATRPPSRGANEVLGNPLACGGVGSITGLPYCPYTADSTWNQALPDSPKLNADSQAMMTGLFTNYGGKFYVNQPGDPGDFPHYYTQSGEPVATIDLTLPYGSSNLQGASVPIPPDAVPSQGTDAHLTVLDQATGDEYDYYQFPQGLSIFSGETVQVGFGNKVSYVTGDGWGGATTGSGAALLAGLVTVDEFLSGYIHHALAAAPGCNNGAGKVYPATSTAWYSCPVSTGPGIPHGSRIWSDLTDSEVDALGVDVVSTLVLKALHHFGGFATDTNGWQALDVRNLMESPATPSGQAWWNAHGGAKPALNDEPASFYTTHFHVLDPCVTQGSC